MHYPKGSVWRKWDLHLHTPSSYDYQDKGLSNVEIVEGLVSSGVRVAAVTDHNIIDVARIQELQRIGDGRITILPGIELCSELGGHNSVHFIGLFHEAVDIEYVWHDLSAQLHLTPKDIEARGGHERVYADIREAATLIHNHNGLVSVHAGKKSNSLEAVSSGHLFKQTLKTDLIKDHVIDILEIGQVEEDLRLYNEIVFPAIQEHLPIVVCSDNHRITEYQSKEACWIKADPGFYGLLQTLVEPEDRIFIGGVPRKRRKVATNKTKYIQSISVRKTESSDLDEIWFDDVALALNHDLVAIIGNKGSGKSALAEVIGLLGNSQNESSFDFLSRQRFRTLKNNRSQHFVATLAWANDTSDRRSLDQSTNPNQRERVKFIPQGLFEEICNDIAAGNENKFNEELEKVIFSHVGEPDRLGKSSLNELLAYQTDETFEAIGILKKQLHDLNGSIVDIEGKLAPEYQLNLESLLDGKQRELEAHDLSKPPEILKPNESTEVTLADTAGRLNNAKLQRKQIGNELQEARGKESKSALLVSSADRALEQIRNFQDKYRLFREGLSQELELIGISFDDVIALKISPNAIHVKREEFELARLTAQQLQDEEIPESLSQKIQAIDTDIQDLQEKLDEPSRLYEAYLTKIAQWKTDRLELTGSASRPGTLVYLQAQLNKLAELPELVDSLRKRRLGLVEEIYGQIQKLVGMYQKLYEPVQAFSNKFGLSDESFALKFDVSIVDIELEDKFFNWVAKNRIGSFYAEGEEVLKKLVEKHDFNEWEHTAAFLDELESHLQQDHRQSNKPTVKVTEQLRKGQDATSLYDYIFSLDYLRPRYVLKLDEKELGQLSPGERGALLLVFYLLVDHDDIPLVIDQPEENLDNQTVYQRLVGAIKTAKERRQILIVTHNPNLAVVCDAEQIICCSIDKKNGNRIEYVSGAIENPEINARIVDILEGTKPAFNNRRSKYAPFENLRLDSTSS